MNPLIATALYSLVGLNGVIAVDVGSFVVAFAALLFWVRIPESKSDKSESVLILAKEGLLFLKENFHVFPEDGGNESFMDWEDY